MFEKKVHYKMYKAGKTWVFAAITTVAVSLSLTTTALADENNTAKTQDASTVETTTQQGSEVTDQAVKLGTSAQTADQQTKADTQNSETTETKEVTNTNENEVATAENSQNNTKSDTTNTADAQNTVTETTQAVTQDTTSKTTAAAQTTDTQAQADATSAETALKATATDTTTTADQTPAYTQVQENDHWYLKDASGNYLTGFQEIKDQNKTVYYDPTNYQMQYGQQNIDGHWYLFNDVTGAMQTGIQFIKDQNKLVYYNDQGQMQYGVIDVKNKKYQANNVTGAIIGKGQQNIDDSWYLFDNNGNVLTGFVDIKDQNKTVYYSPETAKMQYGQQNINGHWYNFDTFNGAMKTGFVDIKDQNKTVYYNNQGQMQYGQQNINRHWYNFDKVTGKMATGLQFIQDQSKLVYYANNGQMQYGTVNIGGRNYTTDKITGAIVARGQQNIDGSWYLFGNNGNVLTGFQDIKDQNKRVYYSKETAKMQYGQQNIDNNWYYFDTYNGAMKTGFVDIKDQNKTVYYATNGQMQYGQQNVNGHWYNFDKVTGAMKTGFVNIADQNKTVYYANNGQMQYGWQDINDHKYYFDTYNGAMFTGSHYIDGKSYTFDYQGQLLTMTLQEYREKLAKQLADEIKDKTGQNIDYDWNNQNDKYLAFSLHDVAQLVARNNLVATSEAVQTNMKNNALFDGKADIVWTKSYASEDLAKDLNEAVKDFMQSYTPSADLSKTALGVGAKETENGINVSVVVFTLGNNETPDKQQATSNVTAKVSDVYSAPGVNAQAKDGLKPGDTIQNADISQALNLDEKLLSGVKGQKISEQDLKMIFSSLPGNTTGIEGSKEYTGTDGNPYHYVFWLNDKENGQSVGKQEAFLAANKDAVYGGPIYVSYSATLTWGKPVANKPANTTSGIPTSQMTQEQIDLAYKTGTNTGLRYDKVSVKPIQGMTEDMIRGVDIGSYQSLINAGVKFYDFNGNEAPIYKVLADAGVNWIRLRVWNDPYDANNNTYAGGDTSEYNVVKMATDASKYGLKVLLDFHYSDFWADPAKQPLPKAWSDQSGDSLAQSVYNYTSKVLGDLKANGVDVGMVQIGNEITNGVFGIYSNRDRGESYYNIWGNKDKAALISKYLSAGSKAVRDTLPNAKVAIQLETPNVPKYRNIMTALRDNGVDYDILGTSYYPFWSTHDGNGWYKDFDMGWGANTPKSLEGVEMMARDEFNKPVVVLETGWINNVRDSDGTGNSIGADSEIQAYSHDPQGQVDALSDMYKALVAQAGLGSFWWEPAWIPVKAGWENWQFNKDASDKYGTGWASKYAVGYAPDSVMYYNGQPTWGGSTWDNVALFDDQGHPLQSLMMYKGFLEGYESPASLTNATSPLTFKITQVWNAQNVELQDALKVGDTLNADAMKNAITDEGKALLTGGKDVAFSQETLEKIGSTLGGLQVALEGNETYYAPNGDAYHYTYWLSEGKTAEQKAWNFANDNKNAVYGAPLVVNVEATVTWGQA